MQTIIITIINLNLNFDSKYLNIDEKTLYEVITIFKILISWTVNITIVTETVDFLVYYTKANALFSFFNETYFEFDLIL